MTPFVLIAAWDQTLIVNRLCWGVGSELLASGNYQLEERNLICNILTKRREKYGDGVVCVDCGANIGSHSVSWAKHMRDWGIVFAIEAQEPLFYALAGNLILNNCMNARAIWGAVGAHAGTMNVPALDYGIGTHFSGFELRPRGEKEPSNFIGQPIDYKKTTPIPAFKLDNMWAGSERMDVLKIDVEGMDLDVLVGGDQVIRKLKPVIYIESFKNEDNIREWLQGRGYNIKPFNTINFLAVHESDIAYDL